MAVGRKIDRYTREKVEVVHSDILIYRTANRYATEQIYTANHATFPIQMYAITI